MILSFKTKINEKPTYFVEKIWKSLQPVELADYIAHIDGKYLAPMYKRTDLNAKLHTIRKDENNRWKKGVIIDFFINARQKNMFRFAPRIPVVSTQKIYISYAFNDVLEITIGSRYIYDFKEKEQIAINDGFDSYEDFFNYFYPIIEKCENEFFTGKIIHWTDLRY